MSQSLRFRTVVISVILTISGISAWFFLNRSTAQSLLARSRTAEKMGDDRTALDLATRSLQRDPHSVEALLFAGRIARQLREPLKAIEFDRQLPESATSQEVVDRLKDAGQTAVTLGRVSDAEFFFKRANRLVPDDLVVHRRLCAIYLSECRRWESMPELFALVKGMAFTLEELAFLGNSEEIYEAEEFLSFFEQSVPDDLIPMMGRARIFLFKGFKEKAESLLKQIIAQHPEFIEAQAQLGVILVSDSRDRELEAWHRTLPSTADGHPEIWWVRGTHARKLGQIDAAIRCAWEILRLDPNHLGATYQMAQLLAATGQTVEAKIFANRASKLEALAAAIHEILLQNRTAERMLRCGRTCEELGRLWEAWAWHVSIETYFPDAVIPGERERLRSLLTPETPRTLPSHDLARRFDYSHKPLLKWDSGTAPTRNSFRSASKVRFEEVTEQVGLDFQYENGAPRNSPGFMIYQSIGGGVAAIDYDLDGATDLFFPQASKSPVLAATFDAADHIFRNVAGRTVDVTDHAIPPDAGYGFGAAVGDFDSDGFPDLYVANAGRNTLLRNNGDGSFDDVTEIAGLESREWTCSTLIADLNGDGLPDLYDVNYASRRAFEHECYREGTKLRRTCIPTEFEASEDNFYLNLGDGHFEEMAHSVGLHALDGRGLGVVAANLDDNPGLDLYIANDMTANFLFLNRTSSPGQRPHFQESGVLTGTAYDSDGRAQASMGIAADDVDGDGLIDLFITNFYNESNSLYHQQVGGFFVEASREFELRNPSMLQLGFGTQFLDADLDGRPDLVVANGHVDDFTADEIPFQMKPQFFHNLGNHFNEISAEQLGPFFSIPQLGRGLSKIDWNRDGREDFVVSRLFSPASLVINRTIDAGHYVAIRLVGKTYRDAIGSQVRITIEGRSMVKQLTAGDGFECSNERRLVFGLAEAGAVGEIQVQWPSGMKQTFADLMIDREYLVVEGFDHLLTMTNEGS